jgi:hypothetical protein
MTSPKNWNKMYFLVDKTMFPQYKGVTEMQHLLSSLYFTVVFIYMFREHFAQLRKVLPTDDQRITSHTTTFSDFYQCLYVQF